MFPKAGATWSDVSLSSSCVHGRSSCFCCYHFPRRQHLQSIIKRGLLLCIVTFDLMVVMVDILPQRDRKARSLDVLIPFVKPCLTTYKLLFHSNFKHTIFLFWHKKIMKNSCLEIMYATLGLLIYYLYKNISSAYTNFGNE